MHSPASITMLDSGFTLGAAALNLEQTIQNARQGDDSAFSTLIEAYRSTAYRLAQQILHTEDAAADALQDAIIKAHRAMHRFEDGNFRSWLMRIVTNTCYDYLRRQKRHNLLSLDELTEDTGDDTTLILDAHSEDPERVAVQNETMQLLLQTIDELPNWHRTVVVLIDVHGYDYAEAADLLHVPLGTVKSRLSRARAALRDQLVERGVVHAL